MQVALSTNPYPWYFRTLFMYTCWSRGEAKQLTHLLAQAKCLKNLTIGITFTSVDDEYVLDFSSAIMLLKDTLLRIEIMGDPYLLSQLVTKLRLENLPIIYDGPWMFSSERGYISRMVGSYNPLPDPFSIRRISFDGAK